MTASIVVGSILLATNQKLGVEKRLVFSSADFVNWGGVQVDEDGARDMFIASGLVEEGLV